MHSLPYRFLKILLLCLCIFGIIFPLSNQINFYQNDDWVYYRVVEWFLTGKYEIHNYIEATFYTQAFMGFAFAKLFGISKLPILSLMISSLNFGIFTYIINKFYVRSTVTSVIIGLLFFLNPLHAYGIFGFMTDNYFLFFLLLTFLFTELFLKNQKPIYLLVLNLFMAIGFFSRQLSIISGITLTIWLLIQKKYKWGIIQLAITTCLLIYYFIFFGRTNQQVENQDILLSNLFNIRRTFSSIYISLLYFSIFLIPFPLILFNKYIESQKHKLFIVISLIIMVGAVFVIANNSLVAPIKHRNNMYYLTNTVEQNGFFYGSSLGEKYKIQNQKQLYSMLDLISKVTASLLIVMTILLRRKLINYFSIFGVLYLGIICMMQIVYDRYLLLFIPVGILAILNVTVNINKYLKLLMVICLTFVLYYIYNFSMEFVLLNKSMWDISNSLVIEKNVQKNQISAGYGWRRANRNENNRYKYVFSFEPKSQDPDLNCCFNLVQTQTIWFPFSFFEKSEVYLYKRKF